MITIDVGGQTLRLAKRVERGVQFDDGGKLYNPIDGSTLWEFKAHRSDETPLPIHVDHGDSEHNLLVYIDGEQIPVRLETDRDRHVAELQRQTESALPKHTVIRAPMPGLLKEILVTVGGSVFDGTALCILEAMKMENELRSPGKFIVAAIHSQAGSPVEKGAVIMELGTILEQPNV